MTSNAAMPAPFTVDTAWLRRRMMSIDQAEYDDLQQTIRDYAILVAYLSARIDPDTACDAMSVESTDDLAGHIGIVADYGANLATAMVASTAGRSTLA